MSYYYQGPKVRFNDEDHDSSPIEATLQSSGLIRIQSAPDSFSSGAAWMTPTQVREFALELLGLADVSEAVSYHGDDDLVDQSSNRKLCIPPF
jgi:hypothetical protein